MAPEVSEEEGSYALHFYCWFLEILKELPLLLVALPGFIDHLLHSCWLECSCYDCI